VRLTQTNLASRGAFVGPSEFKGMIRPKVKLRVLSLIHNAHTAATDLLDDVVMRDGLADERVGA